jgi:chlorite dismutase
MTRLPRTWFSAGSTGAYRVRAIKPVTGEGLPPARRVHVGARPENPGVAWTLCGVVSHARYTESREKEALGLVQPPLGRPEATMAVLIPMSKSARWWDLAQDERRAIFETSSRHIEIGRRYLPAVARRLYHARELGEPFDFLTWFEFAPDQERSFDELLASLRRTEEWSYVEREVEVRLER